MTAPLLPASIPPVSPGRENETGAFTALETALNELPEGAAPGLSIVAALKGAWTRTRTQAAEVNRQRGGRAAGEVLAGSADRVLALLLSFAGRRAGFQMPLTGVALLGMGSFGRKELAPYSDIDLLLLYADDISEKALEPLVGNLLRPLWDSGLQIGHSVRSPGECLSAMQDSALDRHALETATAVLEARFVAGDRAFADEFFKKEVPEFFLKRGRAFVDAKFEETITRWRGLSVYRTQPNLKESPGALRDFQLAMWIDQASQLSGHLPRLDDRPLVSSSAIQEARAGYERLLTFRVSLHALCGRKQDVLDFQMQQAVSEDLAYERTDELKAPELLLRDYFRAAKAVHRLAHTVTRRYLEERAVASRDIERLRRRRVDDDFTRVGDYLYAAHDGVFTGADWLEPALRAFLHAARLGIDISQDMAEAIRLRLPEMTDPLRCHPEAALHFRNLMSLRAHAARTLRSMRDTGLLGSYLPEFGEIESLVINDVFHDYTVDEHTLYVVEALDRLFQSVDPFDRHRRGVLDNLPRPHLLRFACLCHDLGKSRGAPGHSERGALMLPRIGERLGLSDAEVRAIIRLVQEHLLLSRVSHRRDPGEGRTLRDLAERMGSKEHLDMLYLLTYCDSVSVGSGSYPAWKDALLQELYTALAGLIAPSEAPPAAVPGGAEAAAGPSVLETALLAQAETDAGRELAREHCQRVPKRYLVEVRLDEAVSHLELIKRMRAASQEAVAMVRGSGELVDIWVVSTDRPKRFAQICGAFLGAGVSVVSAMAYTRSDGLILDHFRLAPGLDTAAPAAEFWAKVSQTVEETLLGKGNFLARIDAARKRIPRQPQISRRIEPEIRVDNKFSETYTVVDVVCGDRIGLLYSLSRALADLSCDIHFAKIDTNQGLVTDVFYITEAGGAQVLDPEKVQNIKRLLKAIAAEFQEARR